MLEQRKELARSAVPRMLVLGVGSSGTRAVTKLAEVDSDLTTAVVDTDARILEECGHEKRLQIGAAVTNGFSAGGDVELGRQSIEKNSSAVRSLLRKTDLLVIVVGLGGGTGSGAAPVIARIAREIGTFVFCFTTMPFTLEGKSAAAKAADSLVRLRSHADAIVKIPNELLVDRSDGELSVEDAFERSYSVMCNGINALGRLLLKKGIFSLDFACVYTMVRNCDGFCHFAHFSSSIESGRSIAVAEGIIRHRLLSNGNVLKKAAGILVGITGGNDLKLSEVEEIMRRIEEKLPPDTWVNFGVNIDSSYEGSLAVIVLVAEQWKEPLMADAPRQLGFSFSMRENQQGELPLEFARKGRFEKVDPTIHDNQDLDVPTYIRRNIKLPR